MGQIDYIDTGFMDSRESEPARTSLVELEMSKRWMLQNPKLAGEFLERFLSRDAFPCTKLEVAQTDGFITFSAAKL